MKLPRFTLALLFATLASSLSALTFTQTMTALLPSDTRSGITAITGATFQFSSFDPTLGILDSVILEYTTSVTARVITLNSSGSDFTFTPSLVEQLSVALRFGPTASINVVPDTQSATGPTTVLHPNQNSTFIQDFTFTSSNTFTGSKLINFIAQSPGELFSDQVIVVSAGSPFVSNSIQGASTQKITFVYHVPDTGSTAALVAASLGFLALARRRLD